MKVNNFIVSLLLLGVCQCETIKTTVSPVQFIYCGPELFSRQRRPPQQPYPGARQLLVSTSYGFDMYVDSMDSTIAKQIIVTGTWQQGYTNLISHIVKKGDKVLNIGSQYGMQAIIMGKIIGPTGKLFIFEPYSISNKLVTKNIEINNLQNITTIYKQGASDKKLDATIKISHYNTGSAQIVFNPNKAVKFKGGEQNEQEAVKLDRADALLPSDIVLDFALIDVEKMEVQALEGMKGIIQRSPNLVIMLEWQYVRNQEKNPEQALKLLEFMIQRRYKIKWYSGHTISSCQVGKFQEFKKIEELLKIDFLTIFFFPQLFQWPK